MTIHTYRCPHVCESQSCGQRAAQLTSVTRGHHVYRRHGTSEYVTWHICCQASQCLLAGSGNGSLYKACTVKAGHLRK